MLVLELRFGLFGWLILAAVVGLFGEHGFVTLFEAPLLLLPTQLKLLGPSSQAHGPQSLILFTTSSLAAHFSYRP